MAELNSISEDTSNHLAAERLWRESFAALERLYGPLERCDVAMKGWPRRNLPGMIFHARVAIRLGDPIRHVTASCIENDLLHALGGALAAIRQQLAAQASCPAACSGHVVELLPEHGFAVVVTDAGTQVPVHHEGAADPVFPRLHLGDRVWFASEDAPGKQGARIVHIA